MESEFTIAESLRLLADWYEAHPEVPPPYELDKYATLNIFNLGDDAKRMMAVVAQAMGNCNKVSDGHFYKVHRKFGCITLTASAYHAGICTARTVEKVVTKRMPVKFVKVEKMEAVEWQEQEVLEQVTEWDCPESLLQLAKEEAPVEAPEAPVEMAGAAHADASIEEEGVE